MTGCTRRLGEAPPLWPSRVGRISKDFSDAHTSLRTQGSPVVSLLYRSPPRQKTRSYLCKNEYVHVPYYSVLSEWCCSRPSFGHLPSPRKLCRAALQSPSSRASPRTLCVRAFTYSGRFMYVESHHRWPFVSGCIYVEWCVQGFFPWSCISTPFLLMAE